MIARPLHVASGDSAMFHVFRKLGIVKGKKMRRPKMNSKIWVTCLEKKTPTGNKCERTRKYWNKLGKDGSQNRNTFYEKLLGENKWGKTGLNLRKK